MHVSNDAVARLYTLRLEVERLRQTAFERSQPDIPLELIDAEKRLAKAEREAAEHARASRAPGGVRLGPETTGLDATATLAMGQVPTSIVQLLQRSESPLVKWRVSNASKKRQRRVRVASRVVGYSAQAVDSLEIAPGGEAAIDQLPTFFPAKLRQVADVTRASVEMWLEDLDNQRLELHRTEPIWLLARTTVPLSVRDPSTASYRDMTAYLGAFVTPNAPPILSFLRQVAASHTDGKLIGYQVGPDKVLPQVRAAFNALKDHDLTYVNSVLATTPEQGLRGQRVRLPRESLADKEANCIDGTVLFASLLEAMSLEPAIVLVPGHAIVGWRSWDEEPSTWSYLETTMIGSHGFDEAHASGVSTAMLYEQAANELASPRLFRRWSVRELRSDKAIYPME